MPRDIPRRPYNAATGGASSKAAVPLQHFLGISVYLRPQPTDCNDDASSVGAWDPPPAPKPEGPPPAKALSIAVPPPPKSGPWAKHQGPQPQA